MNSRVTAGRIGKLGGHLFEAKLAEHLGLTEWAVVGHGRTKVDIKGHRQLGNISVKNPKNQNTQVFLTPWRKFLDELSPGKEVEGFFRLFFGTHVVSDFKSTLKEFGVEHSALDKNNELRRGRVLADKIPTWLTTGALNWFNSNSRTLFDVIFRCGYRGWEGKVNTLAWAWQKDDCTSVKYYDMDNLYKVFRDGVWAVSESYSTLRLESDGKVFLHLQMKGSGNKNSMGYHAMMFHMHSYLLAKVAPSLASG